MGYFFLFLSILAHILPVVYIVYCEKVRHSMCNVLWHFHARELIVTTDDVLGQGSYSYANE